MQVMCCIVFDRCMENVYTLRYEQTLSRLRHAELTVATSDTVMTAADDDDDDDDDVMNSD